MLKFIHEFEEDPALGDLSVEISPPEGAIIGIRVDGNAVPLYANSSGFTHLAKVFAELGVRDLEEEFHFHVGPNFEASGYDHGKELTVMRLSRVLPDNEKQVGGAN
ncbi:MAG TPA: hypothetical protein VGH02_10745 [Rhizomicrobium sp.]|jgi:uncharacterized protein (DUF362 family)